MRATPLRAPSTQHGWRLAAVGMTPSTDALEHAAGFLQAVSPAGRVDRAGPAGMMGIELRLLSNGVSIKKYPMCYGTHRVIDGTLELAKRRDLQVEDVLEVQATVSTTQSAILRNHAPVTALEAKFSLEFAVAAALVARSVGLTQLTDDFVGRADVRALMEKVRFQTVDSSCPIEPALALNDRVVVLTGTGNVWTAATSALRAETRSARWPTPTWRSNSSTARAASIRPRRSPCTRRSVSLRTCRR
jgi:aconitate decarboxylase